MLKLFKAIGIRKNLTSFVLKNKMSQISQFKFCHHKVNEDEQNYKYNSLTLVRKPAPSFKGTAWWNNDFKQISLDDFKGKWVCLFFYPLDFTFVCPTEIVDFNSKSEDFAKNSIYIY
jgi:peroxiredoxin